jgi:putative ABC transport system permease protein
MIKDFFLLSLSSLRKRKLRSWLTMLGIFIGIAAVVSLISLGAGLKEAITGQFGSLSTDTLTIQNAGTGFGPPGSTAIRKLNEHDVDIIKSVSGVKSVISRLIRVAKLEYNKVAIFPYLGSVPNNQEKIDIIEQAMNVKIADGRMMKQGDKNVVVLGSNFADKNTFGKEIRVGSIVKIQDKEFKVIGIMKPSSSIILNQVIMMMEDDMKQVLGIGDEIDLIVARVDNPNNAERVAQDISEKLRRDRKEKIGEEDFSVQTPLQAISAVSSILNVVNVVVIGIAAISLIIGGIGIMNTMYTSVLERKKEIGTMKAIGAKNKDILLIFLIESGLLGLAGGIVGAGIGLGMAYLVQVVANSAFGSEIVKIQLNYWLLGGAIAFSFGSGLISGLLPALQASKLKPVDSLRD